MARYLLATVGGVAVEERNITLPIGSLYPAAMPWQLVDGVSPAPQLGWSWNGTAWSAPPAPAAPTLAQQAVAALAAGCQIVSTGTPALNGTYAVTPESQAKVMAVSLYIQVNSRFPAGQAALIWADQAGAPHSFATPAGFQVFATALGDYVAALDLVIGGVLGTFPAQPVTTA